MHPRVTWRVAARAPSVLLALGIALPTPVGAQQPISFERDAPRFVQRVTAAGLRAAQSSVDPRAGITVPQVVSTGIGTGAAIWAVVSSSDPELPACAPCDPSDVPGIDRWSIHDVQSGWARAGDAVAIAMFVGSTADLGRRSGGGRHVLSALEALAWTQAATQIMKAGVGRLRPVMYTDEAGLAATRASSQGSFPSGHSSMAFSLATSYFLSHKELTGQQRWWVFGVAAFVGASRVAAAKHFPTDVLAGAALGVGGAVLVHAIRF